MMAKREHIGMIRHKAVSGGEAGGDSIRCCRESRRAGWSSDRPRRGSAKPSWSSHSSGVRARATVSFPGRQRGIRRTKQTVFGGVWHCGETGCSTCRRKTASLCSHPAALPVLSFFFQYIYIYIFFGLVFKNLFICLAVPRARKSSWARDRTCPTAVPPPGSSPLGHQGTPLLFYFLKKIFFWLYPQHGQFPRPGL